MDHKKYAALNLAAGLGTRMQSDLPKVLHEVDGKPILYYSLTTLASLQLGQLITVVGYKHEQVEKTVATFSQTEFVLQGGLYGTAKSVEDGLAAVSSAIEHVIVVYADNSLFVKPETYARMIEAHEKASPVITLATMELADPKGKGRIVRDAVGNVQAIIEEKDATDEQRAITEVNAGLYIFDRTWLAENIGKVTPSPATHEYYLTDLIGFAHDQGKKIEAVNFGRTNEWFGITTQDDLRAAEEVKRNFLPLVPKGED